MSKKLKAAYVHAIYEDGTKIKIRCTIGELGKLTFCKMVGDCWVIAEEHYLRDRDVETLILFYTMQLLDPNYHSLKIRYEY